jgi:hypothetical protein
MIMVCNREVHQLCDKSPLLNAAVTSSVRTRVEFRILDEYTHRAGLQRYSQSYYANRNDNGIRTTVVCLAYAEDGGSRLSETSDTKLHYR